MKEYVDFLGQNEPWESLADDDLERVARSSEVEYVTAGTVIVQAGSAPLDHVWVVRTGVVEEVDRGRVIDELRSGDTFGHVSMLAGMPPAVSVRAAEDTLLLRIPDPRGLLDHPDKLDFTHFGAVSGERLTTGATLDGRPGSIQQLMRPVVWADGADHVADTARAITAAGESCAVVRSDEGFGLVTDADFRARVATGDLPGSAPVRELAVFPAPTVHESESQAGAFAELMQHGHGHLVVTGTLRQPVGVVSVADFLSTQVRNSLRVRTLIDAATTPGDLAHAATMLAPTLVDLYDAGVPSLQVASLMALVTEAILRRAVDLHGPVEESVSWVVLGSMARHEPLPGSDVDTALVWGHDLDDDAVHALRDHAERVISTLESCGLPRCSDGANAVSPLFSRSRQAWLDATRGWLADPLGPNALLMSSLVIDSRPLTHVGTGRALTSAYRTSRPPRDFLHLYLKEQLMARPPTGFVRGLVVDSKGDHRGELDLKRGGLRPVASIGRWTCAVLGDPTGSTTERLRRAADAAVISTEEADTLTHAFEQIHDIVMRREIDALRHGTRADSYVRPTDLDPLTRRHLRETFRSIAGVQAVLENTWHERVQR